MSIGGADLAGQAMRAHLVDELRLFAVPVDGGGKPGRQTLQLSTSFVIPRK